MAQFDVFKNVSGGLFPFVLDVQADVLSALSTRIVVPMLPRSKAGAPPVRRLNPLATIKNVEYVVYFNELASVPIEALGRRVTSLAARRPDWIAALDFVFTGV